MAWGEVPRSLCRKCGWLFQLGSHVQILRFNWILQASVSANKVQKIDVKEATNAGRKICSRSAFQAADLLRRAIYPANVDEAEFQSKNKIYHLKTASYSISTVGDCESLFHLHNRAIKS